ncbi:hypothetical protein NCC49_000789 [Naganishia albida]|nr:hypothetical protein NCC49_000789 [Naganishia albida]
MKGVLMTIAADTIVDGTEPKPSVPPLDLKESKLHAEDEILDIGISKEMWDHLNQQFSTNRPELRQSVMREILGLRLKVGEEANAHLEKFTGLIQQAIASGEPISDRRRCDLFFDTLPPDTNMWRPSGKALTLEASLGRLYLSENNVMRRTGEWGLVPALVRHIKADFPIWKKVKNHVLDEDDSNEDNIVAASTSVVR